MEIAWDGTVDLKFVPCPIVSNFMSYSRKFLKLNTIVVCSRHSKYYT